MSFREWERWRAHTVVGGIAMLSAAFIFTVRPALTYRIIELDLRDVWIGVVGAAYAVAPLIVAPLLGNLGDRWGARKALFYGTVAMSAAGLLLIPAMHVGLLLGGSVLMGLGHFVCLIGLQMAAGGHGRATGSVHQTFAMLSLALSLGQVVGPGALALLGGASRIPPITPILGIMTAGMALCPLLALLWHREDPSGAPASPGVPWRSLTRIPGLVKVAAISGLVVAAIDMTALYLPLLGNERSLASGFVGMLLVLRALSSAVVRVLLGSLIAKWGARRVVVAGMVVATLAMGTLVAPIEPWMMVVAVVVLGVGLGGADPITAAWSSLLAPSGAQGRAASMRFMANRVGQITMPLLAAAIAPLMGAAGGFLLVTLCLAASGGLATRVSAE